jgi:hypothetical protein
MASDSRVASRSIDAECDDPRSLVRDVFQAAVDEGLASWRHRTDDILECHLITGEAYLLTTDGITRMH